MDRGAWRGVVHSITKNQTRLKRLTLQAPALIYSTCLVPVGRFAANRLPRAESATGPGFHPHSQKGVRLPLPWLEDGPTQRSACRVCTGYLYRKCPGHLWSRGIPVSSDAHFCVSASSRWARPQARRCRAPLQCPRAALGPMQAALEDRCAPGPFEFLIRIWGIFRPELSLFEKIVDGGEVTELVHFTFLEEVYRNGVQFSHWASEARFKWSKVQDRSRSSVGVFSYSWGEIWTMLENFCHSL